MGNLNAGPCGAESKGNFNLDQCGTGPRSNLNVDPCETGSMGNFNAVLCGTRSMGHSNANPCGTGSMGNLKCESVRNRPGSPKNILALHGRPRLLLTLGVIFCLVWSCLSILLVLTTPTGAEMSATVLACRTSALQN